jgi:hypothetical protein
MDCGHLSPREPFQEQLASLNPEAAAAVQKLMRAGHDAEAARQRSLRIGANEPDRKVSAGVFQCMFVCSLLFLQANRRLGEQDNEGNCGSALGGQQTEVP